MKPVLLLGSVWLMTLFIYTKEVALEGSSEKTEEPGRKSDSSDVDWDSGRLKENSANLKNNITDYSRFQERTSTTLHFEEWWFYTTRRPIISYKDFPGKPGVATWKEISSITTTESRKSKKMKNPIAEEVSSSSWMPSTNLQQSLMYTIAGTLMGLCYIPRWLFVTVL